MNYHTQNSDSVATVVTDVGRMSVNEKPPYNRAGAFQRQHAFLEEAGVYSGHHGGTGTVQQHGYVVQKAYPVHAAVMNGRAAQAAYLNRYEHHIAGAVGHQHGGTQEYESDGSEEYEDESDCSEEELGYGQHGTGAAQHYYEGYKQEGVQKHGYDQHQHGGDVGGYDAIPHDSGWTVQKKLAYGEQQVDHRHRGIDVGGHQNQTRCLGPQLVIWGRRKGRKRWWRWWA